MLGIIGGVGPSAGIDLFAKIIRQTPAATDQEHLPVMLFSFPGRIQDRTAYLNGETAENPGVELGAICVELAAAGAVVAGIPCNTAHTPVIFTCILDALKKADCGLTLVNMVEETVEVIRKSVPPKSRIGILSTTGTYRHKTYSTPLREAGYLPVVPDEQTQRERVHDAIYNPAYGIKAQSGAISLQAKAQLCEVMDMFIDQGVSAIILGCTEIPLAIPGDEYKGIRLIDPAMILARTMIDEYLKRKRR